MANPHPVGNVATQFKPGNPGGPGRPRKRPLSEAYDDWLRAKVDNATLVKMREGGVHLPVGATNADLVALAQGREAVKGNVNAAKEMREAVEGKSMQRIELTSPEDRGFEVRVSYAAEAEPRNILDMIREAATAGELEDGDTTPEQSE